MHQDDNDFRVRPEDTLYEVELQRALELSVEEAGTTQNTSLIQEQSISNDLDGDLTSANHDIPPCLNRVTPLTISKDTECEEAPHLMSEPPCQMSKVIEGQICEFFFLDDSSLFLFSNQSD